MNRSVWVWLGKELGYFLLVPFLFMLYYLRLRGAGWEALQQHIQLVGLVSALVWCVKFFLLSLTHYAKWMQVIFILLYATASVLLHSYYALVIMGLKTWDNVVTIELIESYWNQLIPLIEIAGYHPIHVGLLAALIFCIYVALTSLCFYTRQPIYFTFSRVRHRYLSYMGLLLVLPLALLLVDFVSRFSLKTKEPIQQTWTLGSQINLHNHWGGIRVNHDFDQDEIRARDVEIKKQTPDASRKNVVLIVSDALRSDHMGVYGYARNTTPYLDTLVKKGRAQLVHNMKSICGSSACGLASIASSRFAHQMPSNPIILQGVLSAYGYQTWMILGGDHTSFYNLKELYGNVDFYIDGSSVIRERDQAAKKEGIHLTSFEYAYYSNDDRFVINQVKQLKNESGRPFFLQLHLMSTHTIGKHFMDEQYQPSSPFAGKHSGEVGQEFVNHYDNGVRQFDYVVQQIFEVLERNQLSKNTVVLITADHGESLGEHRRYSHAHSAKEQLLNIPLVLIDFSAIKAGQNTYHSQTDIPATILHELGITPPSVWKGMPIQTKDADFRPDVYYFKQSGEYGFYDFQDPPHIWKYYIHASTREESLYDIQVDKAELHNLIASASPANVERWRKRANATIPSEDY